MSGDMVVNLFFMLAMNACVMLLVRRLMQQSVNRVAENIELLAQEIDALVADLEEHTVGKLAEVRAAIEHLRAALRSFGSSRASKHSIEPTPHQLATRQSGGLAFPCSGHRSIRGLDAIRSDQARNLYWHW